MVVFFLSEDLVTRSQIIFSKKPMIPPNIVAKVSNTPNASALSEIKFHNSFKFISILPSVNSLITY